MKFSNLWLSIIGFIICSVLLIVDRTQNNNRFRLGRSFRFLLQTLILMNLIVILYSFTLVINFYHPIVEAAVAWTVNFLILAIPMLMLRYITSIFYYDDSSIRIGWYLNILMIAVFVLSIIFGPVVVCQHRTVIINPKNGNLLVILPSLLFLAIGAAEGVQLHKSLNRRYIMALRGVVLISVLSVLLFLRYRLVPVFGFMATMLPLFCIYTLQGRGFTVDSQSGLRSANAFRTSVVTRMGDKTAFRLLLIHMPKLSAILSEAGADKSREIIVNIAGVLEGIKDYPVFRLQESMFAILQDEKDEGNTQEILIALRSKFSSGIRVSGSRFYPGMHVCVADVPQQIKTIKDLPIVCELLETAADQQMCGEIRFSDLNLEAEKQSRLQIIALNKALLDNRMEVWYQPIVSRESGLVESAEALIRMKDEEGNYIRPDLFIPAAEKSGAVVRVGRFVMREVCRFLASDVRSELGINYIEMNLSVKECIQDDLPEVVKSTMDQYGISPDSLNIEITESANDIASAKMMENVQKMHDEYGLSFSLDDFGTGYSNLTRILRMPVNIIKFDRSILLSAMRSEQGKDVYLNTAKVIHRLGRQIVAEGVETDEQMELVSHAGIEYIQGFRYSRPLPEAEFISFTREHNRSVRA